MNKSITNPLVYLIMFEFPYRSRITVFARIPEFSKKTLAKVREFNRQVDKYHKLITELKLRIKQYYIEGEEWEKCRCYGKMHKKE